MTVKPKAAERDDVADIINDIDALQNEISTTSAARPSPKVAQKHLKIVSQVAQEPKMPDLEEPSVEITDAAVLEELSDFHSEPGEVGLEDSVGGIRDDEVHGDSSNVSEESPLEEKFDQMAEEESQTVSEPRSMETRDHSLPNEAMSGMLTLSIKGGITLKLKYEFEGHELTLELVDHCLKVELGDGTEFRVPLNRPVKREAA